MDGQSNLESPMRRLVGPQEVCDEDELEKREMNEDQWQKVSQLSLAYKSKVDQQREPLHNHIE
jgi:hypothetical protein